jgi:hypothetical protein
VRSPARAGFVAVLALALGACGTPSADLFVVERTGSLPDARLSLVVGDGGTVECDGTEQAISSDRLLEARELARDLEPLLDRGVDLPGDRRALLRFRVIGDAGEARFADVSAVREPVLARVVAFTRAVARDACGRAR